MFLRRASKRPSRSGAGACGPPEIGLGAGGSPAPLDAAVSRRGCGEPRSSSARPCSASCPARCAPSSFPLPLKDHRPSHSQGTTASPSFTPLPPPRPSSPPSTFVPSQERSPQTAPVGATTDPYNAPRGRQPRRSSLTPRAPHLLSSGGAHPPSIRSIRDASPLLAPRPPPSTSSGSSSEPTSQPTTGSPATKAQQANAAAGGRTFSCSEEREATPRHFPPVSSGESEAPGERGGGLLRRRECVRPCVYKVAAPTDGEPEARGSMAVSNNTKGLALAVASSAFIGVSFILKKIGLMRAGKSGLRAGGGGYTYLLEPLWWAGLTTMLLGEVANFVAYVFAPAVLVTPLGALSIIVSSVLAHFVLKERLDKLGVLGCISCIVGSVVVIIHAPQEHMPNSVKEIWNLAIQPGFLTYAAATLLLVATLVVFFEPRYGQINILIYLGICSSMGSLTVVSIKAIGVAITLTLDGMNQVVYPHTWLFVMVAIICGVSQLNYLNKALDTFDLAIVSPIYYVMFTTLTIVASGIMFKDAAGQSLSSIASEVCGLITILSGTILLHIAKQKEVASSAAMPWPLDRGSISWHISLGSDNLLRNVEDDYFAAPQSSPAPA